MAKKISLVSGNRPGENLLSLTRPHIVECVSEYILLISKNKQTRKKTRTQENKQTSKKTRTQKNKQTSKKTRTQKSNRN